MSERQERRDWLLVQLRSIADDDTLSAEERDEARIRIEAFDRNGRPPRQPRRWRMLPSNFAKFSRTPSLPFLIALVLWLALCGVIFVTALHQMRTCGQLMEIFTYHSSPSGTATRCFVEAMKRRDLAQIMAVAGPMIGALALGIFRAAMRWRIEIEAAREHPTRTI